MSCWEVIDYLGELTDISAYKEDELLLLCRSCIKEIDSKLKPDADREDFRIIAAAAGLAYYKLALKKKFSRERSEHYKLQGRRRKHRAGLQDSR